MSRTRRENAARRRRTAKRQAESAALIRTQGWSPWSICNNATVELIPAIGRALLRIPDNPYATGYGRVLVMGADDLAERYQHLGIPELRQLVANRAKAEALAWKWIGGAGLLARELRDEHGHNPVRSLGHAMVYLGSLPPHGAPPSYQAGSLDPMAEGETDFAAWAADLVTYGQALVDIEVSADSLFTDACRWCGAWSHNIWD